MLTIEELLEEPLNGFSCREDEIMCELAGLVLIEMILI